MNTRSKPSATANKATKTTPKGSSTAKSKHTSRSKSNRANTTNRVQKRTPTTRKARGYVVVDEDSQTVNNDTSRTASPDYISDTPPPRRREIPETPPPSNQAHLEAENARLRKKLRRVRSHRKDDSEDESSDSEAGDRPRVSFLQHHSANRNVGNYRMVSSH